MTQEEKLKEAKRLYETANADQRYVLESLFPELAESEDERIRKGLIENFKWFCGDYPETTKWGKDDDLFVKDILAWLEKEGNSNNQNWKPSKEQINALEHFVRSIAESGYASPYDDNTKLLKSLINDLYKLLENQSRQEPADKVGPKFKVGDWITNGATKPAQISSIEDDMYYTHNGTIGGDIESMDKDYHLWTIADAKDGDVLVASDKSLFIYDGSINEDGYVGFHIAFTEDIINIILGSDDGCGWEEKDSCHPATKEQRDSLMKAIADAGYTFDFEKKKLKKNSKSFVDGGCKAKIEAEQNLAWSEEDEHRAKDTIYFLDTAKKHYASTVELDACIDWIKSLKERLKGE